MEWNTGEKTTITADGKNLEAICFGPAPSAAPTIIMLHEGLGSVGLWKDFPQRLAEQSGYGVFAYSRAGYGNSDPAELPRPLDYMTREATDVLPTILDTIGFQKGILLGHSDGASIAAIYAGSHEDLRIRGVGLIAPHFFTEKVGLDSIRAAKEAYENGDLKEKLAKHHANVDNAFKGWNDAWLHPDFEQWDIGVNIDHWRIPCLAIQGRDDPYGTLAQIEEIDSRIYSPLDTVIIEECGHAPHIEKPEETLTAVSEFCLRLNRLEREEVSVLQTG